MNKRYHYDRKSDSLFICLKEGEEEGFEEIVPGINVELDKHGEVIGIEILHASRFNVERKRSMAIKG
ncbi:MAG: DUF2283 domain-containing protein [Candidatus Aenigmarchaeota archaeon]|nr:DUF2283 domain-containing protein [Candidatus Aenigmarchaeota archaeon]